MPSRQDSLGFLLAETLHLLRRAFRQRLGSNPLTLAQARALVYVSRNEGVRQVDLAELLEVQPITLARLIDQLAEAGLVERRPDPGDRRAYKITLTSAAAPHLANIEQVAASIQTEALRGLDPQQAAGVMHALRTIRGNLASL